MEERGRTARHTQSSLNIEDGSPDAFRTRLSPANDTQTSSYHRAGATEFAVEMNCELCAKHVV
jgi:hypothetical protein